MINKLYLKTTLLSLLGVLFFSCNEQNNQLSYSIPEDAASQEFSFDSDSIKVNGDLGNFSVERSTVMEENGIQLITFSFKAEKPSELQPISLQFKFPSVDINGYWVPKITMNKVNYYNSSFTSKASQNAPIISFYSNALNNRVTIALSDAINKSEFSSYLKEEDVHFYPEIRLFKEKMPKTTSYDITLRIDTRSLPYYTVIDGISSWWAKDERYKPMEVPDAARKPMYSTWYSYHQNINTEDIVAECKIAKSLGCEAVIVDDGWQTNDENRGYAYTGDWEPVRIGDMKAFVDAVHDEGMKFLLWYSVPFMGEKAKGYEKFKGKYLHHWESQNTSVLDPRYPEIRDHIVNTYITALNDWGLDGFKFDFLAWFAAGDDTKLTKENGRDYASVNEATDALMTEITTRLKAIKPDILIEFRQPYIGPVMRKYGNMFRGCDAPNNAVANKIEVTDLRILSQNTAVHSDMFIWRSEETVEQAALQILNIMYSVPQLSVRLEEIPEPHLDMIRYWFNYWNTNREVLLDGEFIPSNPGSNYPILTAVKSGHQITTVYEDIIVKVPGDILRLDIINAKSTSLVALRLEKETRGILTITNATGIIHYKEEVSLVKGINELVIPKSGMASLMFNNN